MDMSAFIAELEAQFDDERGRDLDALIDELTDAERASVSLSARLAGADGDITLALRGGLTITGAVLDSTRSWVLLRGSRDDSLIMLSAIVAACSGAVLRASPPCEEASALAMSCAN